MTSLPETVTNGERSLPAARQIRTKTDLNHPKSLMGVSWGSHGFPCSRFVRVNKPF